MLIGIVTDDRELRATLQGHAKESGHESRFFASLSQAIKDQPLLIFCEWREGAKLVDTLQGLQSASVLKKPVPIIVLVSSGGMVTVRRAQAAGATDVLFCPPSAEEVRAEIEGVSVPEHSCNVIDRAVLQEILDESLVGETANFRKCLDEMRQASRSDVNVLLVGETGTGKEMIARGIHRLSRRAGNPYVAVNCASLPATLLESELFGHAKGAFTGAQTVRCGRFEAVGAGTLLLDEIGDMETALQMKLLRVIEQREFQRLGENTTMKFHGRLICATSIDLHQAVERGRFRQDLLGRVDQFRIVLPPLRERRLDIPILVRHFLRKHGQARKVTISPTAMDLLESYDYPRNVRQLENAVVSALARSDPGRLILPQHLPAEIKSATPAPTKTDCHIIGIPTASSYEEARALACREIDRIYLRALLTKHQGNQSRAAEEAGIDRGTLAKRLTEAFGDREEHNNG